MPSWLMLFLAVTLSFIAAWLLSEQLSARITRRRRERDLRAAAPPTTQDGRPAGW